MVMLLRSPALASTVLSCISLLSTPVHAYIPAFPTNDTQDAIQNGLNVTDVSTLSLLWYETGCVLPSSKGSLFSIPRPSRVSDSYSVNVAYELVGAGSNGISWVRDIRFDGLPFD
jgi:hypothetical protein